MSKKHNAKNTKTVRAFSSLFFWLNNNVMLAVMPIYTLNMMKWLIGYRFEFGPFLIDYSGLVYATSLLLISCVGDSLLYFSRSTTARITVYATVSMIFSLFAYVLLALTKFSDSTLKWFLVILSGVLVVNLSLAARIKFKEYYNR